MRRRKTDLTARVNGNLQLEFGDVALTSYAGLELFGRYLRMMGFNRLVREAFSGRGGWTDFGVVAMVRLLIGLLVVGGRRVRHLGFVQGDPVFERFCGLRRLPSARTVGRWLRQFTMETVGRLQSLNGAVIAHVVPGLGLRTLTVDVDGVVVSTGQQVERAFRGSALAHNLLTNFQISTRVDRRRRSRKRTVPHALRSIQTLRFVLLNRAAVLVRPNGAMRLRLMNNNETRRTYQRIATALA